MDLCLKMSMIMKTSCTKASRFKITFVTIPKEFFLLKFYIQNYQKLNMDASTNICMKSLGPNAPESNG